MTAVRDVSTETASGIMMVILRAMMGLKTLSDGDHPSEEHRNAWTDLADLLERGEKQPTPALAVEAIIYSLQKEVVPWRVLQLVIRLRTESGGVTQRITELRSLAGGEAIASDRTRDLYVHLHHVVCSEVERSWF